MLNNKRTRESLGTEPQEIMFRDYLLQGGAWGNNKINSNFRKTAPQLQGCLEHRQSHPDLLTFEEFP